MENLRGFDSLDPTDEMPTEALETPSYGHFDDETDDTGIETPAIISGDERRMQVRAYNFWTSQLGFKSYPSIEELHPEENEDFRDFSVLLDFTSGIENPSIPYLGHKLRDECGLNGDISYLDEVPARSLLSRITDHYLQIIANRAPIGFEAEFVNDNDVTIMYRGILLPYSSDDDTIDFIYGVINWKEVADDQITKDIHAEVAEAMHSQPQPREHMPIWGDNPTDHPSHDEKDNQEEISSGPEPVLTLGDEFAVSNNEPSEDSSLADWLISARNLANDAQEADLRGREALYRAIGRAWDFAIASNEHPEEYNELLEESGITAQERAPMTPIVKLVFGANYDKTRLTEFAAALSYAANNEIPRGQFADFIGSYSGGLKGIVNAERRARKVARGGHISEPIVDPRTRLRNAKLRDLSEYAGPGEEFVVLVARRGSDGSLALVGAVDAGPAFTEKALTKTVT